MSTDFRALCAELLMALENAISIIYCEDGTKHISTAKPIVNRARAALADEPAVPQGREPAAVTGQPSDGAVAELVAWLRVSAAGNARIGATTAAAQLNRAAELLQRQALVPVSVSERLPGPSDCAPWPKDSDASAWCWVGTDQDDGWNWEQRSAGCLAMFPDDFTHWLPAHALPLPEVGE